MRRGILLALLVGVLLTGCGTVAPTSTPGPTATPVLKRYTPDDVARVLTPLGASNFRNTPRDPQGLAPNTTIDQRDFAIPSVTPKGGQALCFDSAADVTGMQALVCPLP